MKTKRNFTKIARAVSQARIGKGMSQLNLAKAIGYKNGQFVSNVERGLCSIPPEKIQILSEALSVNTMTFIMPMVIDFEDHLRNTIIEQTKPYAPEQPGLYLPQ